MLHDFLEANRSALIGRCLQRVAARRAPRPASAELQHGIPVFLEQLIAALRRAHGGGGPEGAIDASAADHGRELLGQGYAIEQVVHDYGDLCQAVTELAVERGAAIEADEFRTLNLCLDDAIAGAVAAFCGSRDRSLEDDRDLALGERLGFFAHELRNLLHTAMLSLAAIRTGGVGVNGATGAALERSLIALGSLIDRSLADVRVSAGLRPRCEAVSLAEFVAELRVSALLEAAARGSAFTVGEVAPDVVVLADRQLLLSALGNLLQNAFKFSGAGGRVALSIHAREERVRLDVRDSCGGLGSAAGQLFRPFSQAHADRSGLGLGLAICRRSVEAIGGTLEVRDLPGEGCVFSIELPRSAPAAPD